MRCTVLRSKTVTHELSDKQHQLLIVNYMSTARQKGNSKFNVWDASRLFFSRLLRAQNMVRVIVGKII